jgi:hypothetical protein
MVGRGRRFESDSGLFESEAGSDRSHGLLGLGTEHLRNAGVTRRPNPVLGGVRCEGSMLKHTPQLGGWDFCSLSIAEGCCRLRHVLVRTLRFDVSHSPCQHKVRAEVFDSSPICVASKPVDEFPTLATEGLARTTEFQVSPARLHRLAQSARDGHEDADHYDRDVLPCRRIGGSSANCDDSRRRRTARSSSDA